ncbi:MAG: ABC transporter substrate-binding protein [Hyphomicrobiaceae bacterium]
MSKWIRPSVLAIVASLTLAAPPAFAATPADTLVVAKLIDDTITLDPAEVYEFTGGEVITNVYERIMRFEAEDLSTLVGGAVESWTISDDQKTFTFKLRPGQKFHSGNPVTAEDVAFSLQRTIILNKTPAFLIGQFGWTAENVKDLVKATDESTVQLTIVEDFAPSLVLNLLSSGVASVVEKKLVMEHDVEGDLGNAWLKDHSAGSGAFVLKSWKPNEVIVMEANPDYRLGAPKVKRVIFRHTPEPSAQRLLVEKGDADMARDLTADQIKGLEGNADVVISQYPSADTYYLALSQKYEPLANPKVREAIRYLVDYDGMVNSFLKGQFIVHQSFWPQGFFASYDENPFHLDVEKAKGLLKEAGYPDGFNVRIDSFNTSPMVEIYQSIQQTMAQAGIKAEIVQHDAKDVFTLYRARQHQIVGLYWSPDYMDPHSNADSFARNPDNSDDAKSKPLAWRNSWDIPELTKMTDAAVREKDTEKRKQMYIEIQKEVQRDGAFVIMFQPTKQVAMRKGVQGFVHGPTFDVVYYRLVSK